MTQQPGWTDPAQPQPGQSGQPGQAEYGQLVPHQQAYGQQGYGQQGYGQPAYVYPPSPPTNTMAIVALVLSLTVSPGGIVCGIIARRQIRETGEGGDGLALAGLIVGSILTGVMVIPILIWLVFLIAGLIFLGTGA